MNDFNDSQLCADDADCDYLEPIKRDDPAADLHRAMLDEQRRP